MAVQICALPNLIGRWKTAPIWNRFEQAKAELTFKDSVHFEVKVVVDNSDFSDGISTTLSMGGTYQLHDSLCILTADTTTFSAIPASFPGRDLSGAEEQDAYIILPSKKSDDVIALIDDKTAHEVFVFYRQKEL